MWPRGSGLCVSPDGALLSAPGSPRPAVLTARTLCSPGGGCARGSCGVGVGPAAAGRVSLIWCPRLPQAGRQDLWRRGGCLNGQAASRSVSQAWGVGGFVLVSRCRHRVSGFALRQLYPSIKCPEVFSLLGSRRVTLHVMKMASPAGFPLFTGTVRELRCGGSQAAGTWALRLHS